MTSDLLRSQVSGTQWTTRGETPKSSLYAKLFCSLNHGTSVVLYTYQHCYDILRVYSVSVVISTE